MSTTSQPYTFSNELPLEALQQDTHWYDRKGQLYEIASMNGYHARQAAKKLGRIYGLRGRISPLYRALLKRAFEEGLNK